jgi:hypothetical protein
VKPLQIDTEQEAILIAFALVGGTKLCLARNFG